jgi:hypothetical protein
LLERIDLVDQLRFRLAKAPLPDSGWIGHMPLLANRLCLGRFLAEEDITTPWRHEPIRAGLLVYGTDGSPVAPELSGLPLVQIGVQSRR